MTGSVIAKAAMALFILGCLAAPTFGNSNDDGERLYKERTCIACHGPDAKTPILPMYPKLAGQNPQYLLQQMQDIKSGARSNANSAAMKGVMHLVDESEMKILSEYLAGLSP